MEPMLTDLRFCLADAVDMKGSRVMAMPAISGLPPRSTATMAGAGEYAPTARGLPGRKTGGILGARCGALRIDVSKNHQCLNFISL